jgi:hypothetical protein
VTKEEGMRVVELMNVVALESMNNEVEGGFFKSAS